MHSFKQALNLLKVNWKTGLLFGLVAMLFVYLARITPWIGAFTVSLVLLIFQDIARHLLIEKKNIRQLTIESKDLTSYIIMSVVLLPTAALFGSSIGLLESPQSFLTTIPMALLLMIVASFFFLVLSQALRWQIETQNSIGRSIDVLGLASVKNFKTYLVMSVYVGILVLISGMTKGAGLIVTLPLIFLTNHFFYLEMHNRLSVRAPQ